MPIMSDDFKYVMLDTMKIYFGACASYDELAQMEQTPFKFKAIIMQYMKKEVPGTMTLAEHLCSLDEKSLCFLTYSQLKPKIKFTILNGKVDKKGKKSNLSQVLPLEGFLQEVKKLNEQEENDQAEDRLFVEEMSISKLSLMGFSI